MSNICYIYAARYFTAVALFMTPRCPFPIDRHPTVVMVCHGIWRGLAGGEISNDLSLLGASFLPYYKLLTWVKELNQSSSLLVE